MIVKVDAVKLAEELADNVFSDSDVKAFKEHESDIRDSLKWKIHYEFYFEMITNASIPYDN